MSFEIQFVVSLFVTFLPGFALLYLGHCIAFGVKPFSKHKE